LNEILFQVCCRGLALLEKVPQLLKKAKIGWLVFVQMEEKLGGNFEFF
jgi:hypothetical protein